MFAVPLLYEIFWSNIGNHQGPAEIAHLNGQWIYPATFYARFTRFHGMIATQ